MCGSLLNIDAMASFCRGQIGREKIVRALNAVHNHTAVRPGVIMSVRIFSKKVVASEEALL